MSVSIINAFCKYINSIIVTNNNTFEIQNDINVDSLICCKIPNISIEQFIKCIFQSNIINIDDIDGVILYTINIINYLKTKGLYLNYLTSHRIVFISILLSSKIYIDNNYSNKYWAYISNLKLSNINKMELTTLKLVDFDLYIVISPQKFLSICKSIYYKIN
jgi:hypothetical protein